MKPIKPLFMKTYGKQRRRLPAWISPENRAQAFDSTRSTDDDVSVFEPSKYTRISVARRSGGHRPAKKKALLHLIEKSFDGESISSPSCPPAAQQSKTTREKKFSGSGGRAVRPAKRKAALCLTETNSDEENISRPSPPRRQPAQPSKATRRSRLVSASGVTMRQEGQPVPRTSESEQDSMSTTKCHQTSAQIKTDAARLSHVRFPSAGRITTRRRRAFGGKPKLPKAKLSIPNSSDDFTPGAFDSSRILRPAKRRRRRRRMVPSAFTVSSAENSVNAAGTAGVATNALREISLNESPEGSLGACRRKPIFCSTPSAGPFSKPPRLKSISINNQSVTPPSMSVSCIHVSSTFPEDLNSPGQPVSPPLAASPVGLHSEEKSQSSGGHRKPSGDLLIEAEGTNKTSGCSEEDLKTKNAEESPSLNLLSADDSESSSCFVSAAGRSEWLIEALKEKCLTERCTVQLERLCSLSVTQLCGQTTYSSCLGHSSSVHSQQTDERPLSVDSVQSVGTPRSPEASFNLQLSVTHNRTSGCLQSVCSFESAEPQNTNTSTSLDCDHSLGHSSSMEQSASVVCIESTHRTDSSAEFIKGTQLSGNSSAEALFNDEEAVALKDKCLAEKCTVQLKNWASSELSAQQLQGRKGHGPKRACLAYDEESAYPDVDTTENDHTHDEDGRGDLRCSGGMSESAMASDRQSVNSSSPVAQTRLNDAETEEKAAVLTTTLKEKCLTDKLVVEIKRVTLSQLREHFQLKDRTLQSTTDASDSACDDQTENHHQSESDTNHSDEDSSAIKVNMRKRASTSSEDKTGSDKDGAARNSSDVPHKRKKTSVAPREKKRRSASTDRPGTSRKACVSGLSVSRWKTKGGASTRVFRGRAALTGGNRAADCSIDELISTQHKQPRELPGTTMNFFTPVKASRLNLSSLLADLTPNTHTWSRLKAALSVHRKGMVLLNSRISGPSVSGSPARAELADVSQDLFATPFRTGLPKRLQSQLLSSASLAECEDADLSDAEKVYAECGQQHPLPWEESILPQRMKQCVKIGEGTFGEVFSTTNASGDTVALKIIPLEGSEEVNGEQQKTFGEILHEIIISKELSSLKGKQQNQTHGFIGLNDLHCVQGCYPPDFLSAWDAFDERKGSENDRPDFFQKDQLFIILEFEFGGIDLENSNGTLASLGVAKSILHQVTAALAVAEQELHFEHRDLHWGNVLVKTTKQKKGSFLLNGAAHSLETKGVLVRIIDYSLSRLEIDDLTVSCDISKDEELFMGQGDYQFDIYRLMRQENGNNWSNYHPHTNVLWLHYLCSKLLSMKYRGSGGRAAKDIRKELTCFYDNVLQYSSATEALQSCPMFQ